MWEKTKLPTLLFAAILLVSCKKTTWPVGEARTCLFAKDLNDVSCFTTEQIRNGTLLRLITSCTPRFIVI
jgi:hypothetical protein